MAFKLNTTLLTTILVPCLWGSTYIVFTQTLPVEHPLLVGALRALPAGLLLMALGPGLPPRDRLLPLAALGLANIGLFFALLFVSAARLPGGLAATVGSIQPLIVGLLAWPLLGRRPGRGQILAALAGLVGVALLVLDPHARPDAVGLLAGLASAASMATGTVLIERWGRMGSALALAAWQLTLGGLVLLPVALLVEGLPPAPTALNGLGLGYLVLIGTALAYWFWVRGITTLGSSVAFLGLLSPMVATLLGAVLLGQWLGGLQLLGIAVILGSTVAGMLLARRAGAAAATPRPRAA
ncbi:EamA family transporter [Bosea minatitlanensis]|uniref:EamA family transporter n=1 Tax=Bosea minatitlanensis TaxID=128782 RepID=A0ABW0F0L7_9HYPH|nr:EamA family transporter [Bosea minatitlanensis]MCT4492089.1 DMT family transporter [Bosea minatitlanensis]